MQVLLIIEVKSYEKSDENEFLPCNVPGNIFQMEETTTI